MKAVFVVNPKAGSGKNTEKIVEIIKNEQAEIYITKAVGDAERFVKEYCRENGRARFIACGGDGTLSEVLNGAAGKEDAEIGVMPLGTGNDFCRNFTAAGDFLNLWAQLCGSTIKCDAIRYTTISDGKEKTGYCINMFNIGFDCNVADLTAIMKRKPFISGSLAYLISIFAILIKKKGANLVIELDGKEVHRGPLLLTSVANGSFCGGGINSNPLASLHDGLINTNIIYNISRLNFLTKLPFYMKGTHINLPGIEKIIYNAKCRKMVITPLDGSMRLCVDGEIINAEKTEFEIMPGAFNFVLPAKNVLRKTTVLIGGKNEN